MTAAYDERLLDERKIFAIVNVSEQGAIDNRFPKKYIYYNVRIRDEKSSNIIPHLQSVCNFINRRRMQNKAVFVHCHGGISRSASIVIAYLMYAHRKPFEDALAHVKRKRRVIEPNVGFLRQLEQWKPVRKRGQKLLRPI